MGSSHLSALQIIGQTDDDERLLQALEGLTLESEVIDGENDTRQEAALGKKIGRDTTNDLNIDQKESTGEHGTRSQFIKNVSGVLISRVNTEASNIEEAKQLMHQYMLEFCAEYDRCGYGLSHEKPRK